MDVGVDDAGNHAASAAVQHRRPGRGGLAAGGRAAYDDHLTATRGDRLGGRAVARHRHDAGVEQQQVTGGHGGQSRRARM